MVKKLQEILGNDFEIKEVTTKKNNYDAHGIMIRKKGESVAPILNCEISKVTPEELAKAYFEIIADNDSIGAYANQIQDPCWMREHVYLRMTSDVQYAEQYLNKKVADLYLVPYIRFSESYTTNITPSHLHLLRFSESYTTNITPSHLHLLKITENELFALAMKNMDKDCALYPTEDVVFGALFGHENSSLPNYMEEELEYDIPMMAVTNHSTNLGAASIFCERIQKRLEDIFPDGFYLIPSSIHEFLAVDKKISTPESLKEMISDINRDKVDVEDRLSDAAYCFENGVFLKTMS